LVNIKIKKNVSDGFSVHHQELKTAHTASLDTSSPLCFKETRRGEVRQNTIVFVSVSLG